MVVENKLAVLMLLPWSLLWVMGGIWLASSVFKPQPNHKMIVGIAVGWLAQNWLANLLALVCPILLSFWLAGGAIFTTGLILALRTGWKTLFQIELRLGQAVILGGVVLIYFMVGRGLAIFDDFQHLATISLMASGDVPPHFALDPRVVFGYHHFLQLFAAQVVRVGGLAPWVAVDIARAWSFGIVIMLAALWTGFVTGSRAAGALSGVVVAFGSGTRWLLLLLPGTVLKWLGQNVHLIGSGAGSGANLADALGNAWAVEGSGAIPFPFAFANGIFPTGVIQGFTANGLTTLAIIFLLLLLYNRISHWLGWTLIVVWISIFGLLGEAEPILFAAGSGLAAVAYLISTRSLRVPRALWVWLGVAAAGSLTGLLSGGALTDLLFKGFQELSGGGAAGSYQTVGFQFAAPAVVSAHLGVLPLYHPGSLLVALLEIGPILAVFPLLFGWGWRAFRQQRWLESSLAGMGLVSLLMVFVQFTGSTGVRNTTRLYVFIPLLLALSTALVWVWARKHSARVQSISAALGVILVTGGFVMFGIELVAARRPVYSSFITALDARMAQMYWNRLESGSLIFDSIPYRAPALFGRPTDAYLTWYLPKEKWTALRASPRIADLKAAGFDYVYLDNLYWAEMGQLLQEEFAKSCVVTLQEMGNSPGDFRRLLDIRGCQ